MNAITYTNFEYGISSPMSKGNSKLLHYIENRVMKLNIKCANDNAVINALDYDYDYNENISF
jgi:hypothetical protein